MSSQMPYRDPSCHMQTFRSLWEHLGGVHCTSDHPVALLPTMVGPHKLQLATTNCLQNTLPHLLPRFVMQTSYERPHLLKTNCRSSIPVKPGELIILRHHCCFTKPRVQ